MIRVALKGLARRKLRAALTALAIVLGVAMVSGTYILTDTIKSAFGTVFTQVYKHTDAVVTGKSAISGGEEQGGANEAPRFSEALLARVRALPGVAEAEGGISDTAQLVGRDGKVISAAAPRSSPSACTRTATSASTRWNSSRAPGRPAPDRSRSTPTRPKRSTTRWDRRSA